MGEDKDDRKLSARIVNGINCTPYDIAHQRGYLHAIVFSFNEEDVKTCLSDVLDTLRRLENKDERKLALRRLENKDERKLGEARIVNGINCTPYDIARQRGYLHAIVFAFNEEDVKTCLSDVLDPL